jgi:hypothetical protein
MTGHRPRAKPRLSSPGERDSIPRGAGLSGRTGTSERVRPSATTGSNGLRAERDSLPRSPGLSDSTGTSERGVWGVWRNTPQNRE